ncbi:unnamed protein product [Choristocarpus tenellus]
MGIVHADCDLVPGLGALGRDVDPPTFPCSYGLSLAYAGLTAPCKQSSLLDRLQSKHSSQMRSFETQAGLYDCSWNEANQGQVLTAGTDGVIKLWDLGTRDGFPVGDWREHTREVSGVDWNLVSKDIFASASWDSTVRIWSPRSQASLRVITDHAERGGPSSSVYGAIWAPHSPKLLLSFSGDGTARVLDTVNPQATAVKLDHHQGQEVLSGDWDKYNPNLVSTGCAGHAIFTWDLRNPSRPLATLLGHTYAIRRIQCSPHATGVLASASYDMTVLLWDSLVSSRTHGAGAIPGGRLSTIHRAGGGARAEGLMGLPESVLDVCSGHTEFVSGLSFNLFSSSLLASCAWDRKVCLWRYPPRESVFG